MDDVAVNHAVDLYEKDFYAWTRKQAALLRDGRLDEFDVAHVLEEIESLGRTQVAELRSRLKVLTHHLLKEIYQPGKAGRSWATTIVTQRDDIALHLKDNPSLKSQALDLFDQAYGGARRAAAAQTGIPLQNFPKEPPFTYAQAIDEDFWPGRAFDDRR